MMTESPETILAGLMQKKSIRRRVAKMTDRDLLLVCAAIEHFNQLVGLPSLLWEDATRIVSDVERGRQ